MNPEYRPTLSPHAAVKFKSKIEFYATANLLSRNLFGGIYFGEDEWKDEFGPFVRLLESFIGFDVELWPSSKQNGERIMLCLRGKTGPVPSDPNFDDDKLLDSLVHLDPPDEAYENAKEQINFSWYVARRLEFLDEIYDIAEVV